MKQYTVVLTDSAAFDLDEIYNYIADHDAEEKAEHVLRKITQVMAGLTHSPDRGPYVPELLALGERDFRQLFFKPYRIVYWVRADDVNVLAVIDGRRNLSDLLVRRMMNEKRWNEGAGS